MPGSLPKRCVLIANPAAAGVTAEVIDEVADQLAGHTARLDVLRTERAGDASVIAARAVGDGDGQATLIVALGGDGTAQEIAQGIVGRWSPGPALTMSGPASSVVLVLPAGSGNSTARNLWGEMGCHDVLQAAFDPARAGVRSIDLLRLVEPGVVALLGASSGFLAAVLVAAEGLAGAPRGLSRYHAAAASVLTAMPAEPTIVGVDGEAVFAGRAALVAVGGGRYRAQSLKFLPQSVLDDGLLDVCILAEVDGDALAEIAVEALTGDHLGRPQVTYARGHQITVERTDGHPLVAEYDGDVWAAAGSHLTVDVLPGALCVLASRAAPGG